MWLRFATHGALRKCERHGGLSVFSAFVFPFFWVGVECSERKSPSGGQIHREFLAPTTNRRTNKSHLTKVNRTSTQNTQKKYGKESRNTCEAITIQISFTGF